jgi:hypothetical protein
MLTAPQEGMSEGPDLPICRGAVLDLLGIRFYSWGQRVHNVPRLSVILHGVIAAALLPQYLTKV